MCSKLFRMALVVAASFASVDVASATTPIFLSDSDGSGLNPSFIFQVDQSSGQLTTIASIDASYGEVLGLAAASDNLLYAVSEGGGGAVFQITINPPPATITIAGYVGNNSIVGLAMSSDGQLYAIDEKANTLSILQLSASGVTQTMVQAVRLPDGSAFDISGGDLAEDAAGNWFLWTNATQALYHLDVTTAVVTPVDGPSGLGTKSGLAFDYQGGGALLASSTGPLPHQLLTLDPQTGMTLGSPMNFSTVTFFGDLASPFNCDDGNPCTNDSFVLGTGCVHDPVVCTALDQCHDVGTCDTQTGQCLNPPAPNGIACDDGNACTQTDTCQGGTCTGTPVLCTAQDQCHNAGTCDTQTGQCSNPAKPDGANCNDGNACTKTDVCTSGVCAGTPYTCAPPDQCHQTGTCNGDGTCAYANQSNGSACSDGNACTTGDTCQGGACQPGAAVVCMASDQCHDVGTCNQSNGVCSNPNKPDGSACNNGDSCPADTCQGGVCHPVACPNVDAVVLPGKPLNVTIPSTKTEVDKTLTITVRNADSTDRTIGLAVDAAHCPTGVAGPPDFGNGHSSILVPAGKTKKAQIALTLQSSAFTSFNFKAPARCTLVLTGAAEVVGGSNDPNPSNNVAVVELNVVDKHDPEQTTVHETTIKSAQPTTVNIAKGKTTVTKKLTASVGNADYKPTAENPGDAITLAASQSCTGVTLSAPICDTKTSSATVTVKGGASKMCKITATVDPSQINTPNKLSPQRCTISLTATGPSTPDRDPSNNSTELVLDIVDKND